MNEHDEALPVVLPQPERLSRSRAPQLDRFRIAIAALAGIAVAAIAIAATVLVSGESSGGGPSIAWSPWSPTTGGTTAQQEIADHVAPFYRLTAGKQLDVVTPIELASASSAGVTSGSGLTVAISSASASGSGQSLGLLNGPTVAYNLCGTGTAANCSLAGTPSSSRMLLLRREALELALYTLRYVPGDTYVVVVLPPGKPTASSSGSGSSSSAGSGSSTTATPVTVAVLFDRTELQPWLQVPLAQTLSTFPPEAGQAAAWANTTEAGLVAQLTARGLFSTRVESQQTGGRLLVMTRFPSQ